MKNIIIAFIVLFFASCKAKDNCPAYTYDVIEGDSVRFIITEEGTNWYSEIDE